jgi:hypothetical protein
VGQVAETSLPAGKENWHFYRTFQSPDCGAVRSVSTCPASELIRTLAAIRGQIPIPKFVGGHPSQ